MWSPCWHGVAVLAMLLGLAGAFAVDEHHSQLRHKSRAPRISMIQGAQQRAVGVANSADLDVGDADDDDDDDDDDAAADAKEDKAEEASEEKAAKELEEAQEAALEDARRKKRHAENDLEDFQDDRFFDRQIASQVKLITNETQSASLSNFLGDMRSELRMYNKPSYPAYLEGQVALAEKKVSELEGELGKNETISSGVKEKDKPEKKDEPEKEKAPVVEKLASEDPQAAERAKEAEVAAKKAGETWAISFFANVALLAMVFAMASARNVLVKKYTWFLIDQVIVIFLAVMYFQAFDSLMDFSAMATHYHVLASVTHAVVMLTMVLVLAVRLRRNDVGLAILCGAGAHVVSFSSIHAAATVQNSVWLSISYAWAMSIFGMVVLGIGLAFIGYLVYTAKKKANLLNDDGFMDKTDDLENDFGAMAFSVVFTMFVRFVITGHHPVDDDSSFDHTRQNRMFMLIWACVCLVIAAIVVNYCTKEAETATNENNYAKKRVVNFVSTVSSMNVAWAFLYWGEWQFFGAMYPGEAVKARVMFAIVSTILGGLLLLGLAKLPSGEAAKPPLALVPSREATSKSAQMVAVTALSLIVAWSWELCFDQAVEDMTEGVQHPVGWKIGSTLTLFAIIIPVYANYVRPACKRNGVEC